MADRNFANSRIYTHHVMPVQLDARISIAAAGAPTIITALGITSVTHLATGIYQMQLQDNYNGSLNLQGSMEAPVTGGTVTAGAFVTGTAYQILTVGTTNFNAVGLPSGITAAIGGTFVATGAGSGTGTVKAIGSSGILGIEQVGTLQNVQPFQQPNGAIIMFQCRDAAGALADPASGSTLDLVLICNNSSIR